jgi:hypothetical protein
MRSGHVATAVRELTLPRPAVIRMPLPVVRRLLAAQGTQLTDPDDHLALRKAAPDAKAAADAPVRRKVLQHAP